MIFNIFLKFTGPDANNVPSKMEGIGVSSVVLDGDGNYKAIYNNPYAEYFIFDENETEHDLFGAVKSWIDTKGINATVEECQIISYEVAKKEYEKGGRIGRRKKFAGGGKIGAGIETIDITKYSEKQQKAITILKAIINGNYAFIDSNDPEIQKALAGIKKEPTQEELNELMAKAEGLIIGTVEPIHESVNKKLSLSEKIKSIKNDKFPADHPLMILDKESPQFEEALDEYLEEKLVSILNESHKTGEPLNDEFFKILTSLSPKIQKKIIEKNDKKKAAELGKKAFLNGKKSIPAHDAELMQMLKGRSVGEAYNTEIMDAWLKAWNEENLKAPVEEKTGLNEAIETFKMLLEYEDNKEKQKQIKEAIETFEMLKELS